MNKLDKIRKGLVFEGKKIELQADLKELEKSIDELTTAYSLKSTTDKNKINKLVKMLIVIMSLLVIAAAFVFFATWYGHFTENVLWLGVGLLGISMFLSFWYSVESCRK